MHRLRIQATAVDVAISLPLYDFATAREELYRQFYVHRDKMGDPTSMSSPDKVFNTGVSDMVRLECDGHIFPSYFVSWLYA